MPNAAIRSALIVDSVAKPLTIVKAKNVRAKYSGGPNLRAKLAMGTVKNITPKSASVPAIKEPIAEIPRAGPARPLRAILYPSIHVTTDVASPGILTNIEVVDPPYCAP
jgi:hypothetical protein